MEGVVQGRKCWIKTYNESKYGKNKSEKERKKRKEREDIERNKAYKKGLYRQE